MQGSSKWSAGQAILSAVHPKQAPGGQPLAYEAARALFTRDPQRSWSGYVAGALVVLQREKGARFEDGLSILVSSGDSRGAPREKGGGLGCVRVDVHFHDVSGSCSNVSKKCLSFADTCSKAQRLAERAKCPTKVAACIARMQMQMCQKARE